MASILSAVTVEPLNFICFMAFYLNMVALPQIIMDNVCMSKHNETRCQAMFTGSFKNDFDVVQEESSLWFAAYLVTATFIALFTLPTIGTLSDVFGRKKIMYLTPLSLFIQNIIILLILYSGIRFATWVVILLAPIPAIAGDVAGFYVAVGAYIADITTVKQRTMRFNLLDAAGMLGAFTATLTSGLIIERFGYMGIYVVNLVLLLVAVLDLFLFVKPVNALRKSSQGEQKDEKEANVLEAGGKEEQNSLLIERNQNENTNSNRSCGFKDEAITDLSGSVRILNSDIETDSNASMTNQHVSASLESKFLQGNGNARAGFRAEEDMGVIEEAGRDPEIGPESIERKIGSENSVNEQEICPKKSSEGLPLGLPHLDKANGNNIISMIAESNENQCIKDKAFAFKQTEDLKKGEKQNVNFREMLKHANPVRNFKLLAQCFKESGNLSLGLVLFLQMALGTFAYTAELSVIVNYLKNRPFFLDARDIGFVLAFNSGLIAILGLGVFSVLMTKVFKLNDFVIVVMTFSATLFYYILLGLAKSLLMLYLIQVIHAAGALVTATLRSMISKLVPLSSVGLMMGALLMVETFAVLISSIVAPVTYAALVASYPGAVFFVIAGITFAATIIAIGLLYKSRSNRFRHDICLMEAANNNARPI